MLLEAGGGLDTSRCVEVSQPCTHGRARANLSWSDVCQLASCRQTQHKQHGPSTASAALCQLISQQTKTKASSGITKTRYSCDENVSFGFHVHMDNLWFSLHDELHETLPRHSTAQNASGHLASQKRSRRGPGLSPARCELASK